MIFTRILAILGTSILVSDFCYANEVKYHTAVDFVDQAGCAYLEITNHNIGTEVMFFQPEEPAILLLNARMKVMPFVGIIAKRPEHTLEEYRKVQPGHFIKRKISLNASYGLRKPGKYLIAVNVDYFDPVSRKGYAKGSVVKEFWYSGFCKEH